MAAGFLGGAADPNIPARDHLPTRDATAADLAFIGRTRSIYALELYTFAAALLTLRPVLGSRSVVDYIDNNSALAAISQGAAPAPIAPKLAAPVCGRWISAIQTFGSNA